MPNSRPVGRAAEQALISEFLSGARDAGGALLISGDPGVGKTLLLDIAADMAAESGARVLRGRGVQLEADIGFGTLNQVLLPLMPDLPRLEEAHRRALKVALGFDDGPVPDRLLVSTAVLELLRQASAAAAILVEVDDLQWIDGPSAEILAFVARRVAGSRIGFLGTSRRGADSFFDRSGLPQHELAPLGSVASEDLLMSRFPELATEVQARVLAEAQGNPLALLELPAALSGPQRAGAGLLPAMLPLTHRLQAAFSARVAELPDPVRRFLLLVALDGTGDPRLVTRGGAALTGPQAVAVARRAGLLSLDEAQHRLAFHHPLIRSSVVELATDEQRRAAHRDLAALFTDDPDRRIWHLAAAASEPDEDVAAQLEHVSQRTLRKGDSAGAVAALTRAAELSPDPAERRRRLVHAALTSVGMTGERQRASGLLTSALRRDDNLSESIEATVAASYLMISKEGDVESAYRLLVRMLETLTRPFDPAALDVALYGLMGVCHFTGRAERWQPFHEAVTRFGPDISDTLHVCNETFADPVSVTPQALKRLSAAIDGLGHEPDAVRTIQVAMGAIFVDRLGDCRAPLVRMAADAHAGGAVVSEIHALSMLAIDNFQTGRWDLAAEQAAESIALSEAHEYALTALRPRQLQAALSGLRGDDALMRSLTDEMLGWATPRRLRAIQRYAWQARAQTAIGHGDFEEAYRYLMLIAPVGRLPSHVPHVLYIGLDVVESCMRTNREAAAAAHAAAMEAAGIAAISPRLQLMVTGCAALVATDTEECTRRFTEALAIPEAERWPFELARTQLLYGERLRRAGATRESRAQLNAALETFQWLGARPWISRAQDELRATGQTRARDGGSAAKHLTAREYQIATLAASGLRNKEIAAQLFLSERTVGAHLHRLFPKLGVTSRAGLRDALGAQPQRAGENGAAPGPSAWLPTVSG